MGTLDYYQTLEIVENFMAKTGIRNFCTNVCKGNCCGRCYTSENACHKHEGRRLTCSAFVCHFPTPRNSYKSPTNLYDTLIKSRILIQKAVSEVNEKHNNLKMKPHIVYTGEVYFYVPSPLIFTEFKVDTGGITSCFVDLINPVKKIVKSVMRTWKKIKDSETDEYITGAKFSSFFIENGKAVHYHQARHRRNKEPLKRRLV